MTFRELVVSREAVVLSRAHANLCHLMENMSDVSNSETLERETECKVETPVSYAQIKSKSSGRGLR